MEKYLEAEKRPIEMLETPAIFETKKRQERQQELPLWMSEESMIDQMQILSIITIIEAFILMISTGSKSNLLMLVLNIITGLEIWLLFIKARRRSLLLEYTDSKLYFCGYELKFLLEENKIAELEYKFGYYYEWTIIAHMFMHFTDTGVRLVFGLENGIEKIWLESGRGIFKYVYLPNVDMAIAKPKNMITERVIQHDEFWKLPIVRAFAEKMRERETSYLLPEFLALFTKNKDEIIPGLLSNTELEVEGWKNNRLLLLVEALKFEDAGAITYEILERMIQNLTVTEEMKEEVNKKKREEKDNYENSIISYIPLLEFI